MSSLRLLPFALLFAASPAFANDDLPSSPEPNESLDETTDETADEADPDIPAYARRSRPTRSVSRRRLVDDLIRGRMPVTLREGEMDIRFAWTRSDDGHNRGFGFEGTTDEPLVGLEYGVTDNLTFGAEYFRHPTILSHDAVFEDTGDNIGVSAAYRCEAMPFDETFRLDVNLSDERIEYRPSILTSYKIGEAETYGSLGMVLSTENDPRKSDNDRVTYGYAYTRELSPVVVLIVELDGTLGRQVKLGNNTRSFYHEAYLSSGVAFNVRRRLQVRFGVPIGLTQDTPDYQIVLGVGARL